jgi:hypothetical protein
MIMNHQLSADGNIFIVQINPFHHWIVLSSPLSRSKFGLHPDSRFSLLISATKLIGSPGLSDCTFFIKNWTNNGDFLLFGVGKTHLFLEIFLKSVRKSL